MNQASPVVSEELSEAVTFGVEPYFSPAYAQAEGDRLWAKVWQHACRLEDIPGVGDFVTYDILDDSIIIVRTAPDKISAYHNVCMHRGRRLMEGCGRAAQFVCRFHGWRWGLDGENAHVTERPDWGDALTAERIRLRPVQVDTWGGFVWVNMDPDCAPLREYLEPAASLLDPFHFQNMRYRWRMWCHFDCNWKTALEAFIESYHVEGTHPQLMRYADFYTWSQTQGLHSVHGFAEREGRDVAEANTIVRPGKGQDVRRSTYELQKEVYETVNASTTETLVKASARLVDELAEDTPPGEVMSHFMESARRDDEARGVIWPTIDPEHYAKTGIDWHVFPNMSIQHGYSFALVYRVRPAPGADPNKCVFEASVIELFPEGQAPKTEWVHAEPSSEAWRSVLAQDFANMGMVQKGMKSRAFPGPLLNPKQERPVANFHRNLARFMGSGGPTPLAKS
jgi:phenylpropionate dioxygenase-like ring-hydroxylating dioxygenase large terminal subunit